MEFLPRAPIYGVPITEVHSTKPKPEARPGNIALEVGRPLFESGPNWDFHAYKTHMLGT